MLAFRTLRFNSRTSPCLISMKRILSDTSIRNGSFNKQLSDYWPRRLVENLTLAEKKLLYDELTMHGFPSLKIGQDDPTQSNSTHGANNSNIDVGVSYRQLQMVAFAGFVPFIGFGFLDNAIMIIAGFQQWQVRHRLKDSNNTSAAGLGNLVSDLFGIGVVGYVERFSEKLGCSFPTLTAEQLSSTSVRRATILGRVAGITIGCLLGMLPLLWFDYSTHKKTPEHKHEQ